MRHLSQESGPLDESALRDALREMAEAEEGVTTPPRVEQSLMEAWEAHRRSITPPRRSRAVLWGGFAIAASLIVAVVIQERFGSMVNRSAVTSDNQDPSPSAADTNLNYSSAVWLESDPTTLQIVRLRVPNAAFAAQGYRLSDVDGDGSVEIDVLMGADGEARSIRVRPDWHGTR